jgi:hypothetical protein
MLALNMVHAKKCFNDITRRKMPKVIRTFATKDALAIITTLKPYKVLHSFMCGPASKPGSQHS